MSGPVAAIGTCTWTLQYRSTRYGCARRRHHQLRARRSAESQLLLGALFRALGPYHQPARKVHGRGGQFQVGRGIHDGTVGKWGICLDSPQLLDELQGVLVDLGILRGRFSKFDKAYGKAYDEVYASGRAAQKLVRLVPFLEPDKALRARNLLARSFRPSWSDVIPAPAPRELYELIPKGKSGRSGRGTSKAAFSFLCDPRTRHVTWTTLARVFCCPGVEFPPWLEQVLRENIHFSPVVEAWSDHR